MFALRFLVRVVPLALLLTALGAATGVLSGRARAEDALAADAVLAPGTLERRRPLRRQVGRRLAADAPLAPGSVKLGRNAGRIQAQPGDGEAVLPPQSLRGAPAASVDRSAKPHVRKR